MVANTVELNGLPLLGIVHSDLLSQRLTCIDRFQLRDNPSEPSGTTMNWLRVLQITGAYIAFLAGSGFATGQEAMQFFVAYGWHGIAGTLVSLIFLIYTCASLLKAGRENSLRTNEDAFRYFCGPILGVILTWYTLILIVAVNSVMVAGAAATLQQTYDLPINAGAGIMAVMSLSALLLGLNRIISILGVIGPLIIVLALATAIVSLLENSGSLSAGGVAAGSANPLKASDHWLFSALLYVGLILPGLAGFLPLVGAKMRTRSEVRATALLGPLAFVIALILIVLALLSQIQKVEQSEVPMMVLAEAVFPRYGSLFALIIFLGIFTTITPLLWTVCTRFAIEHSTRYRGLAVGLALLGLVGGTLLPFGKLLNWIYPTVGYVGLVFLSCQLFTDVRRYWRGKTKPG